MHEKEIDIHEKEIVECNKQMEEHIDKIQYIDNIFVKIINAKKREKNILDNLKFTESLETEK